MAIAECVVVNVCVLMWCRPRSIIKKVLIYLYSVDYVVHFMLSLASFAEPQLLGALRLRNDLLCVEWDVKPYTLTHTHHTRSSR